MNVGFSFGRSVKTNSENACGLKMFQIRPKIVLLLFISRFIGPNRKRPCRSVFGQSSSLGSDDLEHKSDEREKETFESALESEK